jgi:uncharacterized protein YkwD/LysM repeat protein
MHGSGVYRPTIVINQLIKSTRSGSNRRGSMKKKGLQFLLSILMFYSLTGMQKPVSSYYDETPTPEGHNATADELIYFTNLRRTQYGLSALTVNSILMTSAQETANIMAGNQISGHLGGASQNISAMGYGNGVTVYSTENVANGTDLTAEYIVYTIWNDNTHNIPVMNPIYCDIGAGVATDSDGMSYYVLRAAYNEKRYCGEYRAPDGTTIETLYANNADTEEEESETGDGETQFMQPVSRVTPNADGEIIHEVNYGQTLWSIAITYGTTIKAIQALNNYTEDDLTVYVGQKLIIPTSLTPYATDKAMPAETPMPSITASPTINQVNSTPEITSQPSQQTTLQDEGQQKESSSFLSSLLWIGGIGFLLILIGIAMKLFPNQE